MKINICSRKVAEALLKDGFPKNTAVISFYDPPSKRMKEVLPLDRLLFESNREETDLGGGFTIGNIKVRMAGVIRAYLPGRAAPLATIQLVDSVAWEQSAELAPILSELLPSPEEALRDRKSVV